MPFFVNSARSEGLKGGCKLHHVTSSVFLHVWSLKIAMPSLALLLCTHCTAANDIID